MECTWLDYSLAVAKLISHRGQPFIQLGTEHVYGTTHPATIRLDRPGIAATSMMNHLFRHVIAGRYHIINSSDKILDYSKIASDKPNGTLIYLALSLATIQNA